VLRIAREGLERLARCAKEQIVADAEPREGQPAELVGQREDDAEVQVEGALEIETGEGSFLAKSGYMVVLPRGQLTLGDLVDADMEFAKDAREAVVVSEDLLSSGRIRLMLIMHGAHEPSGSGGEATHDLPIPD
jgi:hypothetical protein